MTYDPDGISRTAKIFLDAGEAETVDEAEALLRRLVLQVRVGADVQHHRCRQAALLTIVNAGSRAFLGGVRVLLDADFDAEVGWADGELLSDAVRRYGGEIVEALGDDHPTIVVGTAEHVEGATVLRATFDGWTAGVIEHRDEPLPERDVFVPAGVAAGGIAVAEAFEFVRGTRPWAGRRAQGLSLWAPGTDWRSADAVGPDDITWAPSRYWLVGLGHLGQGYLWSIGMFTYAASENVRLLLEDTDIVSKANLSTGLLLNEDMLGGRKTRVVAARIEQLGLTTNLFERRLVSGEEPILDEPRLALIGVDNPQTRRVLSDCNFDLVIDVGLGGGPTHYLDIQLRSFPGDRTSKDVVAWQQDGRDNVDATVLDQPGYRDIIKGGNDCGALEIAGRTVGASFVGAVAGALAIAEAMRSLRDEHRHAIVDASLSNLRRTRSVRIENRCRMINTGYTPLR